MHYMVYNSDINFYYSSNTNNFLKDEQWIITFKYINII